MLSRCASTWKAFFADMTALGAGRSAFEAMGPRPGPGHPKP